MNKRMQSTFPRETWPLNGQELSVYNPEIYNALLFKYFKPKTEEILRNSQNGFRKNRSATSQILNIHRIFEGIPMKNLETTLFFVDFLRHEGKIEQMLLAYGLPKETVAAIIMFTKCSLARWRHRLLWHCYWSSTRGFISLISNHNLPRRRTSNVDRSNERKRFYTKTSKSIRYSTLIITDAGYAVESASGEYTYPSKIPAAKSKAGSRYISLHVNEKKMEYICFNKKRRHLRTK